MSHSVIDVFYICRSEGCSILVLWNDYVLYLAESKGCSIFGTLGYCILLNNWYFNDIFQIFQIE